MTSSRTSSASGHAATCSEIQWTSPCLITLNWSVNILFFFDSSRAMYLVSDVNNALSDSRPVCLSGYRHSTPAHSNHPLRRTLERPSSAATARDNTQWSTAHFGPSRHFECSLVWDNGLVLGGQRSAVSVLYEWMISSVGKEGRWRWSWSEGISGNSMIWFWPYSASTFELNIHDVFFIVSILNWSWSCLFFWPIVSLAGRQEQNIRGSKILLGRDEVLALFIVLCILLIHMAVPFKIVFQPN